MMLYDDGHCFEGTPSGRESGIKKQVLAKATKTNACVEVSEQFSLPFIHSNSEKNELNFQSSAY